MKNWHLFILTTKLGESLDMYLSCMEYWRGYEKDIHCTAPRNRKHIFRILYSICHCVQNQQGLVVVWAISQPITTVLTHWGRDKMAANFPDDTFKRIFLNENILMSTKNSLKFVAKGLINNIPALVLIMAWRRPGDKPLSEPMLVRSLTHICVTRPQWVNWRSTNYRGLSNDRWTPHS